MKTILTFTAFLMLLVFASCEPERKNQEDKRPEDAALIKREIADFYSALGKAYNGIPINTDSIFDNYFDRDVYYVTYWGITEPIDSTKSRLRRALPGVSDYQNRIESMFVKVYDDGAYAFFILRQSYILNKVRMEEYLPTTFILERREDRWVVVHSHRSADFQTVSRLMEIARQK